MSQSSEKPKPDAAPSTETGPPHSRLAFWFVWFCSILAGWFGLRLVLLFQFLPSAPLRETVMAMLGGFWRDLLVGLWLTLPVTAWVALFPPRRSAGRCVFWAFCAFFGFSQTFLLFVEYFFFEEFRSRFNTVAVDYLQYPTEVFVNIWDSYHVGIVLAVCLIAAAIWVVAVRKKFSSTW
ncbi:MAG TPA: hypothetical protein VL793_01355, partial [Patescibacteria group bacterium]|nr:hypothetical protein [Patescibacteria group bacterium]